MNTFILILVIVGSVNGGCKYPRQLRGSILRFEVDQTAPGNKRVSVGKFAIDAINRRTFLKTRDKSGYTQWLAFYDQKRIYYVGPSGICHSYSLTESFQDYGVPHSAHLFGHGQIRRQGYEPSMDIYAITKLKEYHIMKVTTDDCLPISTTSWEWGSWYTVHIDHFYNLSLGIQPDDFKVPRRCRFGKRNSQRSSDSLPLSRGLKPPPFRVVGDAGENREGILGPPFRILGDAEKMSRNKISSKYLTRILGDKGNEKRATQSRELYSRLKILDGDKNLFNEKQPRLQSAPVRSFGDQGQTFHSGKSLRSNQPKLPFRVSDDTEENKYFENIKDSPPIRILG